MSDTKRRLNVLQGTSVMEGTTCFAMHAAHNVDCQRRGCKQWIHNAAGHNCVLISVQQHGSHTFQAISEIYEMTRMRIYQIEQEVLMRLKASS